MSAPEVEQTVVTEAERLAGLLRVESADPSVRVRATADVRKINAPCLLVEPIPARSFDPVLCEGLPTYTVTWRVVALAAAPGDLAAARVLDRLTTHATSVLSEAGLRPTSAQPGAYYPGAGTGADAPTYPAVVITLEGNELWQ